MSVLTLYHGSPNIIEKPVFGYGNEHNDYGMAFYCTENIELAREWAVDNERDGFANCYKFDTDGMSVLSLGNGDYNILNWLAILLENRTFRINSDLVMAAKEYVTGEFGIDYKSYDVIRGYRADDSYFSFANAFLNNGLSLEKLCKVMKLGKLGEQIAIKSKRGIDSLRFVDAYPADCREYYAKKKARDDAARNQFKTERLAIAGVNGKRLTDVYVMDIMREGWKNDDARIPRIIY